MEKVKGKSKKHAEKQPEVSRQKDFVKIFAELACKGDDDSMSQKLIDYLRAQAGSYILMALDAGLFSEHKQELLIEYHYGKNISEREGWLSVWRKLTLILRIRRGLSLFEEPFSENCRLIVAELKKNKDTSSDEKDFTWQAEAIALAFDHRDWTSERIAGEVGRDRKTLYKDKYVRAALKARNRQKRPDKRHYPAGDKNPETGDIEAWQEPVM